jgi:hypothetical protein
MQVPAKAYVCGHCRKRLRASPLTIGCLGLLGFVVLLGIFTPSQTRTSNPAPAVAPTAHVVPTFSPEEIKEQERRHDQDEREFLKTKAGRVWAKHTDWDRELCGVIANGQIHIGMTAEQVRAAWGRPERVNSSVYATGTHEQWVYGAGQYVYFENGVMTSLHQSR